MSLTKREAIVLRLFDTWGYNMSISVSHIDLRPRRTDVYFLWAMGSMREKYIRNKLFDLGIHKKTSAMIHNRSAKRFLRQMEKKGLIWRGKETNANLAQLDIPLPSYKDLERMKKQLLREIGFTSRNYLNQTTMNPMVNSMIEIHQATIDEGEVCDPRMTWVNLTPKGAFCLYELFTNDLKVALPVNAKADVLSALEVQGKS